MVPNIFLLERAGGKPVATAFRTEGLSAADPFADGREIAWNEPGRIAAGRVAWSGMLDSAAFPHTETLVVHAGEVRLSNGATTLVLRPGQSAVITRGTAVQIAAEPGSRWAFCAATGETSAEPGLQELLADAPLTPSNPPAAAMLIGETPSCRSCNAYDDDAAGIRAGTWDSTPYRRIVRPQPVAELMHLLAGSVELADADGKVTRVETGDTVFVAQGAPSAWDSREHVAKFYLVQENGG
ncbi:cupin domain-containing protein [Bosea lathyri]|uniref:Predicted enzyme of the cupin superfamily n=1 Tax=Bosea lathyri TaxID=1036778 RepID=A0A1H5RZV5_9HYPH|nr:cupin domain-containing protein [Bosea lathyri]SEF43051.1 Predicted enzyme of the cupin superfamily [Bosea lathyri]